MTVTTSKAPDSKQTPDSRLKTLDYSYYPGCTLHSSSREYDVSSRLVFEKLGLGLHEIEGWTCCGAGVAQTFDPVLALALPARDIDIAGNKEWPIAVACAKCFSRLKTASIALGNEEKAKEIALALDKSSIKPVEVLHMLQILDPAKLDIPVMKHLKGLKVACYYGCLLVRPRKTIGFDHEENPMMMDNLMSHLGAEPVSWSFKTECCGAGFNLVRKEIMLKLTHRILKNAGAIGAECAVVACPLCYNNLEVAQREMNPPPSLPVSSPLARESGMPVIFFTELLALALGIPANSLMLNRHLVNPLPLLKSKGLV